MLTSSALSLRASLTQLLLNYGKVCYVLLGMYKLDNDRQVSLSVASSRLWLLYIFLFYFRSVDFEFDSHFDSDICDLISEGPALSE